MITITNRHNGLAKKIDPNHYSHKKILKILAVYSSSRDFRVEVDNISAYRLGV